LLVATHRSLKDHSRRQLFANAAMAASRLWAIQFAKQNAEACFAAASELGNAKDIQDLLAIQSRSAQTQMQAYALQAQELGRLMVEAAQSVQPSS
jgi:hypothetical protein